MDLRVLFLCKVHPTEGGGAELRTWEIARRLQRSGMDVTILTTEPRSGAESLPMEDNVQFEFLPSTIALELRIPRLRFLAQRLQFYLSRHPIFEQLISREKIDIVHFDMSPFVPLHAYRVSTHEKIPKVVTIHNLRGGLSGWLRSYGALGAGGFVGESSLLRGRLHFDRIISPSRWLIEELRDHVGLNRLRWVPNGVDTTVFQPLPLDLAAGGPGPVRFLWVGRFVALKGYKTLLRAFSRLTGGGYRAHLTLAGGGPGFRAAQVLSQHLGLARYTSFLGHVPHAQMPTILAEADVFVLPSRTEGLSVALLEAISCGLPVIVSDIPGNREVAKNSFSLFFAPTDEDGLLREMVRMVEEGDQRLAMGPRARQFAVDKLSWESISEDCRTLFEECVEQVD